MSTNTDLHANAQAALNRAIEAKFEALHQWALDNDFNGNNQCAYERASAQVIALMGRTGASQHIES